MINFVTSQWASSDIRGRQIASMLGSRACVNPSFVTPNDKLVLVKAIVGDDVINSMLNVYMDIIDGYGFIDWVLARPHINIIAISRCSMNYLATLTKRNITWIPEHHCNFERRVRKDREVKVVGYCGETANFNLDFDEVKKAIEEIGMTFVTKTDFKTREDVVEFYKSIDVQLCYRRSDNKLYNIFKNPLKVVNACSFGIPTIAYPEESYVDEVAGHFLPATNLDSILNHLTCLKNNSKMYSAYAISGIELAEDYHIDNIIKMYKRLLGVQE